MKLTLFHYWRSSSSWRVRWGLHLKGLNFESVQVCTSDDETDGPDHLRRNPMGFVPTLCIEEDGKTRWISETLAILLWLEERFPSPALLPSDPFLRARAIQLAQYVACGIQPLVNFGVVERWTDDEAAHKEWWQHWLNKGLRAVEEVAGETAGKFLIGDTLTLADLFVTPQCWGAIRKGVDFNQYPTLKRLHESTLKLESCRKAHPDSYDPALRTSR